MFGGRFTWIGPAVVAFALLISQLASPSEESNKSKSSPAAAAREPLLAVADGRQDATKILQTLANQGSIALPPGTFRISRTIEFNLAEHGPSAIHGDGATRLIMCSPGPALRFLGTHGGTADPPTFKPTVWERERMPSVSGIEILGEHPEADGIEARGTMQLTVSRVLIRQVRHAIHLVERNRNVLIADCHLYDNRGAGVFYDDVNLHQSNISACHISYNRAGGVVVRGGDVRNIQISGCDIEANMSPDSPPTANVLLDCANGSVAEVAIVGCTIQHEAKSPNSANIRILGEGKVRRQGETISFQCGHVTIADNVLSDVQVNVDLQGVRGATVTGNTFWQGYSQNLVLDHCQQIVLQGNLMERNPLYGYAVEAKNGVLLNDCRDITLSGLHLHAVRESPAGLVARNCRRLHINNCTILDCENAGILWENVRDSRLADCLIRDDRDPAKPSTPLRIRGGEDNTLTDNTWLGVPDVDSP